jgi:hypothetical protein
MKILATVDELRVTGSVSAAMALAQERLLVPDPSVLAGLYRSFSRRLASFPPDLRKDVSIGGKAAGIVCPDGGWPPVVIAEGFGRSCCMKFDDGHLAVVDAGFFVNASLFVFFVSSPSPAGSIVASAILGLAILFGGRQVPFAEDLVALAMASSKPVFEEVLRTIVDMVALHEIGHAYVASSGSTFLAIDTVPIDEAVDYFARTLAEGRIVGEFRPGRAATSVWDTVTDPATGKSRLVLPGWDAFELNEYAPDVFALLARSVLDAQGSPRPETLALWNINYFVWTIVALMIDLTEAEVAGGAWNSTMRNIIRISEGARPRSTHPASPTRNDVVLFHLYELWTAVDGKTRDAVWPQIQRDHDEIWSNDAHLHLNHFVEVLREGHGMTEPDEFVEFVDELGVDSWSELSLQAKSIIGRVLGPFAGLGAAARLGKLPISEVPGYEARLGANLLHDIQENHDKLSLLGTVTAIIYQMRHRGAQMAQIDKSGLRRELGLVSHQFGDWEKGSDREHALSAGEIVSLLVGFGGAIAMLNTTLKDLDKTTASIEHLIKRMRSLYDWSRKARKAEPAEKDDLSEREKLLVSLFDAHVTDRKMMSVDQLAARVGGTPSSCETRLRELEGLGLASPTESGEWYYRVG